MDAKFQKMISTLSQLENYLRIPPQQKGKRASDIHNIRVQLDKNIGSFLGKNNPTVEDDIEYIESFNYFINNEDFGLDDLDLLSTLNSLNTAEQTRVLDSMQEVIEQSESIINRYNKKAA